MDILKTIDVQQTQAGESAKYISTYEYFKNELELRNIDSIFNNPRLTIKRDLQEDGSGGQKYIFNIDGENRFSISEANIESFIRQYCKKKETLAAEEDIYIQAKGLKIEYFKSKTKQELQILKKMIEEQNKELEKITDIESIKIILSRNLLYLEQQKEYAKNIKQSDKIDRNLRKAFIAQVEDRIDRLNRMKASIETLEQNKNKKYTIKRETANGKKEIKDIVMDDINGYDMKQTLMTIGVRLKEIANEETDFLATRNAITNKEAYITAPYYEIIINDKKDAKRMLKALKKYNKGYGILDKISLDANKKEMVAKDLEEFENYLNQVINGPDTFKPSEHPFVPKNKDDFWALIKKDEDLSALVQFNKIKTHIPNISKKEALSGESTSGISRNESTETEKGEGTNKKEGTEYTPSDYDSGKEAFEKGGIKGLIRHRIDKTNMKPEQKQFRGGIGNLAITGGIIFLGWKMISSAFKLIFKKEGYKDSKNRGRLLGPVALIFGAQARSGEGPLSLFKGGNLTEKIAGVFGRGSRNKETTGDELTQTEVYTEGFIGLMGAFDMMTYGGMATVLEETPDGKMKIKEDQYDGLIATLENGNDNQKAGAKFLKTHVGKNDKNGLMDLTLRSMGITSIQDLKDNPNKEFQETAAGAATRVYSIYAFMEKEGFVRINPETMHLVNEYIADPNATVDDLENLKKRGDVFETQESITDQTGLAAKIKTIAGTDTIKERDMINGINDFYEYRPTGDKSGLDIIGNGPVVEFKTYGYTTKINTDTKKIDGLNTDKFDSYAELFKAANLTNRLKYLCKDRTAVKENPFYIQSDDLMFDNAKIFSRNFDTEMVEETTLKNISPTLSKFDDEYCTYLNSSTPKFRKTSS